MPVTINGSNTPTAGGVVYGDGTAYATTAAGTSGRPIVSGGSGAPTFRPYTLPASDGSANQVLQTNGSGALSFATISAGFTLATPVSTASGDTAEFTGLPSTVRVILVNLNNVSVNANNYYFLQLGTSDSYVTSGYSGNRTELSGSSTSTNLYSNNAGFSLPFNMSAAATMSGTIQITQESVSSNTWVCSGIFGATNTGGLRLVSGSAALSGTLTRLKVIAGGGGLFDGGEINIAYI